MSRRRQGMLGALLLAALFSTAAGAAEEVLIAAVHFPPYVIKPEQDAHRGLLGELVAALNKVQSQHRFGLRATSLNRRFDDFRQGRVHVAIFENPDWNWQGIAGTRIDIHHLVACHRELVQRADAVVVEGAGGFLVPLTPEHTGADLAQALGLPVLLVVGLRLGCLNHALLSAEAIRARGLTLTGWVANRIDPAMDAADENIAFLRQRLGAPLLADIPHSATPDFRAVHIELP